jgi:cytidylate kinase
MIIAIDGPAASGKGTLATRIAAHFGLHHLDTGLLYRAVARDVKRRGGALDDAAAATAAAHDVDATTLNDPVLRGPGAGEAASIVARVPEVREALREMQREFARQPPGAVLDGRDIGTVVCPYADCKIYVTATPEVRAQRRYREMIARGEDATYAQVLEDICRRDERDSGRAASPMLPAADAFLLDTSNLDIETAFNTAVDVILRKVGQRGRPR